MVVGAPYFPLSPDRSAVEGPFLEHLKLLRAALQPDFDEFAVAAPVLSPADHERRREGLVEVDRAETGIRWVPLHRAERGNAAFWRKDALRVFRTLDREVRAADAVHAGISHNSWRPVNFAAIALAVRHRVPSIFVVDIDHRRSAAMLQASGLWSRREAFVNRWIHDRSRHFQLRFAVRRCSLVLLKSRSLCEDYGRGQPHVREILDAAHSETHLVPEAELEEKLARLLDPGTPLRTVFFGRFVAYKGLDRSIRAIACLRDRGLTNVHLDLVGLGPERPALERLVADRDLGALVHFVEPLAYGPALFALLRNCHLQLATPLAEDTPRAALDGFACGLPIVAFDTYYYRQLAAAGAATAVPWPSVEALADRLAELERERATLVRMSRQALRFARENTQEIWIERRVGWTRRFLLEDRGVPGAADDPAGA